MLKVNSKLRKIATYSLPAYISSGIGVITFPLIASSLSVADYGRLDLLLLFITILNISLHCGWGGAHNRLYFEPGVKVENLIKSTLCIRLFAYVFSAFWVCYMAEDIANWGDVSLVNIEIVFTIFVVSDLLMFFQYRYRMRNEGARYLIIFTVKPIVYVIMLLFFWYVDQLSVMNALLSVLLSNIVPLIMGLILDGTWYLKGFIEISLLKRILRFGLPLFPAALSVLALNSVDRLMINTIVTDSEEALVMLGLFAVANRMVAILGLATNGFTMLWGPYVMKTFRESAAKARYKIVFSTYLFFVFLLSVIIIVVGRFLVPIYMPEYIDSIKIMHLLMASSLLYSVGAYFCIGIGISEKNEYKAFIGIFSLCINVVLNYFFIPEYGLVGAGFATYCSMITYVFSLMMVSERFYKVGYSVFLLMFCSLFIVCSAFIENIFSVLFVNVISVLILFLFFKIDMRNAFNWLLGNGERGTL